VPEPPARQRKRRCLPRSRVVPVPEYLLKRRNLLCSFPIRPQLLRHFCHRREFLFWTWSISTSWQGVEVLMLKILLVVSEIKGKLNIPIGKMPVGMSFFANYRERKLHARGISLQEFPKLHDFRRFARNLPREDIISFDTLLFVESGIRIGVDMQYCSFHGNSCKQAAAAGVGDDFSLH